MQNSSAFQFLALDTIHESATNPRRTFEESKLHELAESIRQHGLIQPITLRPNSEGFEIVAGARRFRAAQLAELFAIPARIVDIDDAQAQEWQLVENSMRVDVHPYEEAEGFRVRFRQRRGCAAEHSLPTHLPVPGLPRTASARCYRNPITEAVAPSCRTHEPEPSATP